MSAPVKLRQAEIQNLQNKEAATNNWSLNDLEKAYWTSQQRSRGDSIREFLRTNAGITTGAYSLNDLWRAYFIVKGVANRVSLGDMAREYFGNQTLP